MTKSKVLIAAAAAILGGSAAHADVVIHITGSTAFRAATITSIQNLMGGAGNFKGAFSTSSGANITASSRAILQGTMPSVAGSGVVTIKCFWTGSVGGIKTLVKNLPVTTWPSVVNLPATNTIASFTDSGVTGLDYRLDFAGETPQADVTMADNSQATTGFSTPGLTEIPVGVIPFEWVGGNGTDPLTLTNITPLLVQAAISGGAPLSLFTGVPADLAQIVYVGGRNFDSGTRLACLTEASLSPFAGVQHVEPTVSGTAGANGSQITHMKLYHAESVLDQSFGVGQSGYGSGGALADVLATPGAASAQAVTGIPPAEQLLFGAGHIIGMLGRSDAVRAVKKTSIAGNSAHRLKYNGIQIWQEPVANDGNPAGYNDNLIKEGVYSLWEFENLSYRGGYTGIPKNVADAIAADIKPNIPVSVGVKLGDMHVTKSVEGGVITSNQI